MENELSHTEESALSRHRNQIASDKRSKFASDIVELLVKEALNELQNSGAEAIDYALALLSDAQKYTKLLHHGHTYGVSKIMEIGTMLNN